MRWLAFQGLEAPGNVRAPSGRGNARSDAPRRMRSTFHRPARHPTSVMPLLFARIRPFCAMFGPRSATFRPCAATLRPRSVTLRPCAAPLRPCGAAFRPCGALLRPRGWAAQPYDDPFCPRQAGLDAGSRGRQYSAFSCCSRHETVSAVVRRVRLTIVRLRKTRRWDGSAGRWW